MRITYPLFILSIVCIAFPLIAMLVNLFLNLFVCCSRKNYGSPTIVGGLLASILILTFQTYNILFIFDFLDIRIIGFLTIFTLYSIVICLYDAKLDVFICLFLLMLFVAIIRSRDNYIDSVVFLGNVVVPFLLLYLSLTNKLRLNYDWCQLKFIHILLLDIIVCMSILFAILDVISSFEIYRFSAENLAAVRNESVVYLSSGIPANFQSSIMGVDFLRYVGFLADPLRSAYLGMFLTVIALQSNVGKIRRSIYFLVGLIMVMSVISKGSILMLVSIVWFSILLRRRLYTLFVCSFVCAACVTLILATDTSTSGWIHLSGLIGPFNHLSGLNFVFGDKLYLAGNMGRLPDEFWTASVLRGAESLVGTYMYAFGVVGVILLVVMHFKMIVFNIIESNYVVSAFCASSLIVILLQEGHYNSSQALLFIICVFVLKTSSERQK